MRSIASKIVIDRSFFVIGIEKLRSIAIATIAKIIAINQRYALGLPPLGYLPAAGHFLGFSPRTYEFFKGFYAPYAPQKSGFQRVFRGFQP